jgi:hypothetical protein
MVREFDDTVYYEASSKEAVKVIDLFEMRSTDILFKGRSEVVWMI